jgi:ABC-type uncharacterized transport system substrate-binding protein
MNVMLDRKRLGCSAIALLLVAAPLVVEAQQTGKVARVGWLGGGSGRPLSEQQELPTSKAFTEGMLQFGYVVGENLLVERRVVAPDEVERYPGLAARLVTQGVDVILAANPYSLAAAVAATRTIPIVGIDLESDPVAAGWAATLGRPGRNLTGFFLDIPEMSGKHIQFLKEMKPNLVRLAVLGDPRVNELQFHATETAARTAGVVLHRLAVTNPNEIDNAIAQAVHQGASALLTLTSPLVNGSLKRIADAALRHHLPAICAFVPGFAEAGGLLAYGPDFPDLNRRAAGYVGRILKGTKPADLPIQRPEKFQLVINARTAKALQLSTPQSLLLRADRMIE